MSDVPAWIEPFLDVIIIMGVLITLTRIAGLRSFSKMSGHDFAITVAMGSVLASVVVGKDTDALTGVAALVALFGLQAVLSLLRVKSGGARNLMDNAPLLIMKEETILDANLKAAKMTRSDLYAKLREANVLRLDEVRAVVFEQTGDVSVLHGDREVEDILLEGVRDRI